MEVVGNTSHQNRDAEGLQAVEQHNYPEVVPGQDFSAQRRTSWTSPESYVHSNQQQQDQEQPFLGQKEKSAAYVGGAGEAGYFQSQQPQSEQQPGHQTAPGSSPPQYEYPEKGLESQQTKPSERRICGLGRKAFFIVLAIALLVILGIALGVGLGVGLSGSGSNDSSSSNGTSSSSTSGSTPYTIADRAGVALLNPSGSSSLYAYYVDDSGMIVETAYQNGAWSQNNTQLPSTTMNVTSLGRGGNSPIAAVSYNSQGDIYRCLFFFDSNGHVLTTNTTGNNSWPTPYQPSFLGGEVVASEPNTMSLTAVAGSTSGSLNGIRVYLGSNEGRIQEIGMDFDTPGWNKWAPFPNTDPTGGVSSVIVNNVNHLYLRSSQGQLQQWTWNYQFQYNPDLGNTSWTIAANSTAGNGVAEGGSIAVASDGQSTDYIFYQDATGQTVQALYTGTGTSILPPDFNVQSIRAAPVGYTLAATYANGAVVMNQNSTAASQLLFSSVSRNGQSQGSSTST